MIAESREVKIIDCVQGDKGIYIKLQYAEKERTSPPNMGFIIENPYIEEFLKSIRAYGDTRVFAYYGTHDPKNNQVLGLGIPIFSTAYNLNLGEPENSKKPHSVGN